MVRFIPSIDLIEDGIAGAERKVFFALRDQLDDAYTVFHSLEWVSARADVAPVGEIDFLVFHREKGVLVCEVKGGAVRRTRDGQWRSRDRSGSEHDIKDPGRQALRSARAILAKLKKIPRFRRGFGAPLGHCVIFPDGEFDRELPHIPREIIIDASGIEYMAEAIDAVFDFWQGKFPLPGLSRDDARAALDVLSPEFQVVRTLSLDIHDENAVFVRLTGEQKGLLDFLGDRARVFVSGRAGSGKTILAMDKARRDAAAGRKTLYLCFNAPLAGHVARELEGTGAEAHTFHHFVRLQAEAAGLPWPESPDAAFWAKGALDLFVEAQEKADVHHDSLVIDEGQDFKNEWWLAVETIVENGGALAVFFDRNQALYGEFPPYLEQVDPYRLERNCRCTEEIDRFASAIIGIEPGNGHNVKGEKPVEERFAARDEQVSRLQKLLHRLVAEEGLSETQIVIIGTHRLENSCLATKKKLGNFEVAELGDGHDGPGRVAYSTLHRFKGLEADVVVLVDVEYEEIDPHLYYVGATRAKNRLFVMGVGG